MTRYIDADALTDELIKGIEADTGKSVQTTFTKSVCMILCKAIEQQPTIDAEPVRHGQWISQTLISTSNGTYMMHQCSECGSFTINRYKYCPNCGCRMDEE